MYSLLRILVITVKYIVYIEIIDLIFSTRSRWKKEKGAFPVFPTLKTHPLALSLFFLFCTTLSIVIQNGQIQKPHSAQSIP